MKLPRPTYLPLCFLIAFTTAVMSHNEALANDPWTLSPEQVQDNGVRGEAILNAYWQARSATSSDHSFEMVAVPGYVKNREAFHYFREFDLLQGWDNRRLTLEVGEIAEGGRIIFNGHLLVGPETDRKTGKYVELPLSSEWIVPGRQRLELYTDNPTSDIWLRSYPSKETSIDSSYITTSFRQMTVNMALEGRSTPGEELRAIIRIYEGANVPDNADIPVKVIQSDPFKAKSTGAWGTNIVTSWPDAKLWTPDTPNLYHYTVQLLDGSGETVDAVLPRRFGFREVWLEPKRIMLNGVPLYFSSDTQGRSMPSPVKMREQIEAMFKTFHGAGLRACWRISGDAVYDVADETGTVMPFAYIYGLDVPVEVAPALREDEAGDAGGDASFTGGDRERYEASKAMMRRLVHRWREHPSIVIWQIRTPWSRVTLDSTKVGRAEEPWKYWPGNRDEEAIENNRLRYEVASITADYVRKLDPHRPISSQNQPDLQIAFATRYLCDNLDLQEREMFFEDYLESDSTRVVMPSEAGMPFAGHQFIRHKAHQMPQGGAWPAIHLENAARLFGDEVYLQEPMERFPRWHRGWDSWHKESPVYQRLTAENIRHLWRAWRSAGINTMAHWVLREGFRTAKPRDLANAWQLPEQVDPRRAGGSEFHDTSFPIPGVDVAMEGGQAYLKNVAPVLAWIGGGPASGVHNKDHIFTSGDTIDKAVIVLNDTFETLVIQGSWKLTNPDGNIVASGPLSASIAPGQRGRDLLPLRVVAPQVQQRSDYELEVRLQSDGWSTEDSFAVTVFPKETMTPRLQGKLWYMPGEDLVIRQLRGKGIDAAPLTTDGPSPRLNDLLLVPRNAFVSGSDNPADAPAAKVWAAHDLDNKIADGLSVIVLEQNVPNLLGLQTERVRPRRVFAAGSGHPVLAGLESSDLTYWTGASDLEVDVPETNTPEIKVFPERLWQVSNENSVATRTLIRPQVGAARAILVSGFGLHETPLLEVTRGKGRLLFCQLDVSNRYGHDPVATRIVNQMLAYAGSAEGPDPNRSVVVHMSSDSSSVIERPQTYLAAKPKGVSGIGITQNELFFRESIYTDNWVTKTQPDGIIPVFADKAILAETLQLPQVIRRRSDGQFEITLSEDDFTTPWAKQKVAWIRAALIVNQGGSLPNGPILDLHGNEDALYPHQWLTGFINPYTAACW